MVQDYFVPVVVVVIVLVVVAGDGVERDRDMGHRKRTNNDKRARIDPDGLFGIPVRPVC
jgi:hypothetical protein